MMVVLAILLGSAMLALAWQHRQARLYKSEGARLERELGQVVRLAHTVTGGDWLRTLEGLVEHLVADGVCRAAVVLAALDSGLEQRAAAFSPGESGWELTADEALLRLLQERKQPVAAGTDGRIYPVLEDGELVGVLAVRGARADAPPLTVATRLAALSLTGMRQYHKQAALSNTDGLTGLANHRHFQQVLGVSLAQAYLENEPLALILVDIDHFKKVNDTYGHLLGDLVLREMAYLLRRELPPEALAARYGGEEMAVVLRGADAAAAGETAERLRQVIEGHQVFDFSSGTRLSVTVSLGVALYELGQGKSRLIARADEALYTSKREGRNRVTVAARETVQRTSPLYPS